MTTVQQLPLAPQPVRNDDRRSRANTVTTSPCRAGRACSGAAVPCRVLGQHRRRRERDAALQPRQARRQRLFYENFVLQILCCGPNVQIRENSKGSPRGQKICTTAVWRSSRCIIVKTQTITVVKSS
eukprot:5206690-Pleurochrysis_carterae.AAC.3